MSLIRWNPLGDLDDLFGRFPRGLSPRQSGLLSEGVDWRPAANITENDKEYLIKADTKDGVLVVHLPKQLAQKPEAISIKVGQAP